MSNVSSKSTPPAIKEAAYLLCEIAPQARTRGERRLIAHRKLADFFSFYRVCQIDRQSSRVVVSADELQIMREAAHGRESSASSRIEQRLEIVEAELASLREFRAQHEAALAARSDR